MISRGKLMVNLVMNKINNENSVNNKTIQESDEHEFDSDDSVKDPNYTPSISDTNNYAESEIEKMALELETNILRENSNVQKTSKSTMRKEIKMKRNCGQSYTTSTNKIIKKRKCVALVACRSNCQDKLSFEQQRNIFDSYWSLGEYKRRVLFVAGLIEIRPSKRTMADSFKSKNRKYTYYYHVNVNGLAVKLCQKCFRNTLGETDNFIKSVAQKKIKTNDIEQFSDKRGKTIPLHKITEDKIAEVKNHILSFPAYESHYTRNHTSQLYFESHLTISTLYRLYCKKICNPVSLSKYSQIFKGMGIKFRKPTLDSCKTCDLYKIKIAAESDAVKNDELIEEQRNHHEYADLAYREKLKDKEISKQSHTTVMFTFDLQQCLPTPFLKTSEFFYKRPLWTFNLTVHDSRTNNPSCFMWYEAIANRGGNEIASCIFEHLSSLETCVENVIYYSDSCPGQNKNSHIAVMFSIFLQSSTNIRTIDHKFLIPGHTHMECDSDHALIEKKKKKTNMKIHHPRDWYQFVRSVGEKRHFTVVEMNEENFLDFGLVAKTKFTFRKKSVEGDPFNWNKVKWLRYTKEYGKILFKNSYNEDENFKTLLISKRGINNVKISQVGKCYDGPIPINSNKKNDLLSLLQYIDEEYHDFYKNLKTKEDNINIHPDFDDDSDDEQE